MKKIGLIIFIATSYLTLNAQISFKNLATNLGVEVTSGDVIDGGGISFQDYNQDGWDDITIGTEDGTPLIFYRNNLDGTFTLDNLTIPNTSQHKQINWVDYDNDGDKDLLVASNFDGIKLYTNDGNLNFTDSTQASGLPINYLNIWGSSWGDFNNDGFLDVFFSVRDNSLVSASLLYQNNQDGTFTNVSQQAGILTTSNLSFCSAFFDYDNDGWQDIYLANDKVFANILYHNNGDGTFTNKAQEANVDVVIDAMSTTIGDYNNDGWFDIYITNTPGGNVLFKNNQDGTFTDIAEVSGTSFDSFGWGAVFLDAENDMDLDLYVSGEQNGSNPNWLSAEFYENIDNDTFISQASHGFEGDTRNSYSNAIGDTDNDGLPEIIVNNGSDENIFLWKNQSITTNNWLKIKLEGTVSNRDGIGSVIEVYSNNDSQYRYTLCGEGYLSQNSSTEFFGLGQSTQADYVKVTWLSGIEEYFYNVQANQVLEILEGTGTLGVPKNTIENTISIFPNPTSSVVNIRSQNQIATIEIIDVLGKKILKIDVNKESSNNLDITTLKSGVYFLRITSSNRVFTSRLIKQ